MSHGPSNQFVSGVPSCDRQPLLDATGRPITHHDHDTCGEPSSTGGAWTVARRSFVLASLGFLAACATQQRTGQLADAGRTTDEIGGGVWGGDGDMPPARYARPVSASGSSAAAGGSGSSGLKAKNGIGAASRTPTRTVGPDAKPVTSSVSIPSGYDGKVIARSAWTSFRPDPKIMERMPTVTRITVHHEGNSPYFGTSAEDVKARLVNVLNGERGVGHRDIAYHYVIDPAGRVWEARDLRYEGRHTRNNYDANLGVMCLGNFEEQRIPPAQLAALEKFIKQLQAKHKIAKKRVYTHQELSATLCPGKDLQKKMGTLRSRL